MKYRGKRVLGLAAAKLRLPIVFFLCLCFFLAGLFGSSIISQVKPLYLHMGSGLFAFVLCVFSCICFQSCCFVFYFFFCRMRIGADLGINCSKILEMKKAILCCMVKVETLLSLLYRFRLSLKCHFYWIWDENVWLSSYHVIAEQVLVSIYDKWINPWNAFLEKLGQCGVSLGEIEEASISWIQVKFSLISNMNYEVSEWFRVS